MDQHISNSEYMLQKDCCFPSTLFPKSPKDSGNVVQPTADTSEDHHTFFLLNSGTVILITGSNSNLFRTRCAIPYKLVCWGLDIQSRHCKKFILVVSGQKRSESSFTQRLCNLRERELITILTTRRIKQE